MRRRFIFRCHSADNRKGQALVLEEMMMFALGVLIVAGVIFIFRDINDSMLEFVREQQAEEVNGFIKSHVMSLKNMDCDKCHVTVSIPEEIGGKPYTLLGEDDKRKILLHDNDNLWNEKNLSVELYGLLYGGGTVRLEYEDGKVTMRGVGNY